jgi:REP element-mobilizing transposase RayT
MSDTRIKKPISPERIVDPRSVAFSEPAYRGVLPHMHKPGCTYFVTFCLADVARKRAIERKNLLESDDPSEIFEATDFESTKGACILKDKVLADIVESSLLHFQGRRYALNAWCVMPNHVHVIVTPLGDYALTKILQSWKGFTGNQINRRLNRSGPVWQKESFDHIVRNLNCYERFVSYVERNPVVAGLVSRPSDWQFSSARHREDL